MAAVRAFIRMLLSLFFKAPETSGIRRLRKQLTKLKAKVPERCQGWGMFLGHKVRAAVEAITCRQRRPATTKKTVKELKVEWQVLPRAQKQKWADKAKVRAGVRRQDVCILFVRSNGSLKGIDLN